MSSVPSTRLERKLQAMLKKPFGRWTVRALAKEVKYPKGYCYYWECECQCGTRRAVPESNLTRGLSMSCGCARNEIVWSWKATHGLSRSREYRIYKHMLERCYQPRCKEFSRYGGRGIAVCHRWLGEGGFERFYADMGPSPSSDHQIDRFPDNNGPYSPENCRWATRLQQGRNKRNNRFIEFRGERRTLSEWAELTGLPDSCIRSRLDRLGWTVERALTTMLRSSAPTRG